MKRILQNHKNFYAYLTKFGHNINKLFSDEINLIFRHDTLPEESLVLEVKNAKNKNKKYQFCDLFFSSCFV